MCVQRRVPYAPAAIAAAALIFLAAAIHAAPVSAQGESTIRKIEVIGNKRIEPEAVQSYLGLSPGDHYDAQKADEGLKKLYATGLFRDVKIKIERGVVIVSVAENPIINRIAFEGAKELSSDTLAKESNLKPRSAYTRARVQEEVQRILNVYRREGFYAAHVEPKLIELDGNRVDVVFEIREGSKTKVTGINFIGNQAFSDAQLRSVISTTESGLLDFLRSTSVYDPDRFNLDRELLQRFYLKNGFADMRVVSAIADVDKEGQGFFLTFSINEGPRYTFGTVDVDVTLPSIKSDSLRNAVLDQPGKVYNAELVDKTVEKLTAEVAKLGHPFGQVRTRIERDAASRTISVAYVIEQGPRVYIERIDFSGNFRTHDHVIRREFRIAEGDAYNKTMVEAAKQRLMRLGFFKNVKIDKHPGSGPDKVVLDVKLEEQQTGELGFAVGYSSTEGVIGEVSYSERNLMGTGQYLQIKLSGSVSENGSFTVSWTEPRFLDSNLSFGIDAFVRNSDYTAATGYIVAGYADFRAGGTLRLGFPVSDNWTVGTNYTLMLDNVYNVDPNASLAVKQIQGPALISSVGYSVAYDTRDNKRKPTSGIFISAGQDFAGVGGDVDYIRSTADLRGYYPLTNDITLAGRALGGTIMGWGGQGVRIVDAFYRGGETIPGFAPAGLGPRDAATGDALGGTIFYAATSELRFPLPFVPQDLGLSGAVFISAGSVFGTDAQRFAQAYAVKNGVANNLVVQTSSMIRSSAGGSLIWDSPVGPLRADFAGAITKAPFDKTQLFNFSAGGW